MTDPRAPLPSTVRLVVDEYVRTVRSNEAAAPVVLAIDEGDPEIVYELVETACEMGFMPRTNADEWWTNADEWWAALRDALPLVAEALR